MKVSKKTLPFSERLGEGCQRIERNWRKKAMTMDLYRHFDKDGILLYVGISKNAIVRFEQHRRHSEWFHEIAEMTIEKYATHEQASEAEWEAVLKEKPLYNKNLQELDPPTEFIWNIICDCDRTGVHYIEDCPDFIPDPSLVYPKKKVDKYGRAYYAKGATPTKRKF